jgi:hypothetical protein
METISNTYMMIGGNQTNIMVSVLLKLVRSDSNYFSRVLKLNKKDGQTLIKKLSLLFGKPYNPTAIVYSHLKTGRAHFEASHQVPKT